MAFILSKNSAELINLVLAIHVKDPDIRKTNIKGIQTLLTIMSVQEVTGVIDAIREPKDLRFLYAAGIAGISKGYLDKRLMDLAQKGII